MGSDRGKQPIGVKNCGTWKPKYGDYLNLNFKLEKVHVTQFIEEGANLFAGKEREEEELGSMVGLEVLMREGF